MGPSESKTNDKRLHAWGLQSRDSERAELWLGAASAEGFFRSKACRLAQTHTHTNIRRGTRAAASAQERRCAGRHAAQGSPRWPAPGPRAPRQHVSWAQGCSLGAYGPHRGHGPVSKRDSDLWRGAGDPQAAVTLPAPPGDTKQRPAPGQPLPAPNSCPHEQFKSEIPPAEAQVSGGGVGAPTGCVLSPKVNQPHLHP